MLNVIFIFPKKYLPDRRLLPQFAKANNKIVKAIKKNRADVFQEHHEVFKRGF